MTAPPRIGNDADELLLRFVEDRDVPCPGCGYNLRDLTTGRCPECGQALQLGLRLAEPRQGALIAGLVGLAAGAGLGGLLLVYALIVTVAHGERAGMMVGFILTNALGFVAHGVALGLWVRNWNRIRRAPAWTRHSLLVGCWAMPLAFVWIFALVIR